MVISVPNLATWSVARVAPSEVPNRRTFRLYCQTNRCRRLSRLPVASTTILTATVSSISRGGSSGAARDGGDGTNLRNSIEHPRATVRPASSSIINMVPEP